VQVRPLGVEGAFLAEPTVRRDERGDFCEWFRADEIGRATGRRFDLAQVNQSVSRTGVIRGVHFADVPPGQAKYVACARGAILDVVVDIRVGSPSYGRYDVQRLDGEKRRAVFVSEGLGHAFCALTDDATVVYLCSTAYDPAAEHRIDPLDPELALPWPPGLPSVVSGRDATAPTLAAAAAEGLLPDYAACRDRYAESAIAAATR
jgi:dTDP-4-dehydrorhamnose 3,5-epimerase